MNENLDLTKILKDCPKGTKFYSRCLGSVEFCKITSDNYIEITDKLGYYIRFKLNGIYQYSEEDAELDLFPSKDQRDWSKWQRPFKDGDILICDCRGEKIIYIFRELKNEFKENHYVALYNGSIYSTLMSERRFIRFGGLKTVFATEEEKQLLFDTIRKNGYEWDAERKELKKIEKFDISILKPFDKVLTY